MKTIGVKHDLEVRVRERTFELEEEIEERKKIESELKKVRNYISNIIDSMPSILVGVDSEIKITQWNKKAHSVTGISADQAKGQFLIELLPHMEGKLETIRNSIQNRRIIQEEKIIRKQNSRIYYDDMTIYPLVEDGVSGAVIRVDDVTEKVRLEEMMIQSEKMLSVGGLAAGMAHEINNPLGGMMQTASVMENRLGKNLRTEANILAAEEAGTSIESIKKFMDSRGIPRMIQSINYSGQRVAGIINNMLDFSRKSEGRTTYYSINELIDKTLELASSDYDLKKHYDFKAVRIEKEYDPDLPPVPCESSKLQQVFLNLLRNGAQAMLEGLREEPVFIIRTQWNDQQKMIRIEFEDNGPGMTEDVRKRVFEPFFTTKDVGVGTGLGLSVSYFIITENHNGKMEVESHPGHGAKFIIYLPVSN
jgi:PAS domain S-box-containing protein